MPDTKSRAGQLSQHDKFKKAAREHGADEDEARWDAQLRKIAQVKPKPEKPE